MTTPRPGDFFLKPGTGLAMAFVRWGTGVPVLKHGKFFRRPGKYGHAGLCIGPGPSPDQVTIIEATPKNVVVRNMLITSGDWSTGGPLDPQLTPEVRARIVDLAESTVGKRYDWPSIVGFVPRWWSAKFKGYAESTRDETSLFCSELVVWAYRKAGVTGLLTGRAPDSIAPVDLVPYLPV